MTPEQALNNLASAVASNSFTASLQTHQVIQESLKVLKEALDKKVEETKKE